MQTKIICWNFRGLSNVNTVNWIKLLIKKHLPYIICLAETRADAA